MITKLITAWSKAQENRKKFLTIEGYAIRSLARQYTYTPSRNILNIALGVGCIVVGVVTWYIPFTTIPLITLGLFLISCPLSIKTLIKGLYKDIKFYVGVRL